MCQDIRNVVILTGSGISAESGLATFRGGGGLWDGHRVEDVATPEAFLRNPKLVQDFYNMRRAALKAVEPNKAHQAIADFEKNWNRGEILIITQNVDDLHERAGSKNLIHMHGELKKARCNNSEEIYDCEENIEPHHICKCCNKKGTLRPHIVWFGEMPLYMERIYQSLHTCDLFISIGTSGTVYPAAGFVEEVRNMGIAHTIELNLEPSSGYSLFHQKIYGKATDIVPEYLKSLL